MRRHSEYVFKALELVAQAVRDAVGETLGSHWEITRFRDPQKVFRWAIENWQGKVTQALRDKYGFNEGTLHQIRTLLYDLKHVRNAWAHNDPSIDRADWVRRSLLNAAELLRLLGRGEWADELVEREREIAIFSRGSDKLPPNAEALAEDQQGVAWAIATLKAAIAKKLGYEPGSVSPLPDMPSSAEFLDYLGWQLDKIFKILIDQQSLLQTHVYEFFEVMDTCDSLYIACHSLALESITQRLSKLYEILEEENLVGPWLKRVKGFADQEGISLAEAELFMALYAMRLWDGWPETDEMREIDQRLNTIKRQAENKWPELDERAILDKLWEEYPEYRQLLHKLIELRDQEIRRLQLARIQKLLGAPLEELKEVLHLNELLAKWGMDGYNLFEWLEANYRGD